MISTLILTIIMASCNNNDKQIEVVQNMYKNMFIDIDDFDYKELSNWENGLSDIPKWINERFNKNISENCYNKIISNKLYQTPIEAYKKGRKIRTDKLKVKKNKDEYILSGYITLVKDINIADYIDVYDIKVSGTMRISHKNVITDINIDNFNDILNKIK